MNPDGPFRQASAQQISMKTDHYDPIAAALKEDIGEGDITTDFFVPETLHATGRITAREKAIVAGIGAAAEVFRQVDPSIDIQIIRPDGDEVVAGDVIIEVRGLARSILKAERVALNFLQHLCGIATLTRQFVDAIGNHSAKILDTRKTTPGLRALEKAAVVAGGGVNHRFGLYDMVLVKDNHLATLGGLSSFADRIQQLRQERPNMRIEVEADDLEQARAFAEVRRHRCHSSRQHDAGPDSRGPRFEEGQCPVRSKRRNYTEKREAHRSNRGRLHFHRWPNERCARHRYWAGNDPCSRLRC